MPRKRPENGLDDLVRAAATVFASRGFARAQMADIAREMGVSAGALYGYVESKEALFDLVLQRAFVAEPAAVPSLPVPTPPREDVVRHARERLASARSPALSAALRRGVPGPGGAATELQEVLREIYDFLVENRQGLALVEAAANDRPELAAVYYRGGRSGLLDRLERYLLAGIERGDFEPVADVAVAARLLLETIAWFTRHRFGDFDDGVDDDGVAEDTVIAMLTRSVLRSTP